MALQPANKQERYEFLIIIESDNPVAAQELSELISALAKDYSALNSGRKLAVSRIIRGSIWLYIADLIALSQPYASNAVDIAQGTKSILEFGKSLRETISHRKDGGDGNAATTQEVSLKSVEAILKIAEKNDSYVKLRQVNSDGSFLEAEISPTEARKARRAKPAKASNKLFKHKTKAIAKIGKSLDLSATRDMASRIESLMSTDPVTAEKMVEIFVTFIKQRGNEYMLVDLAVELDILGYHDLAEKVRAEIDDGREEAIVKID